MGPGFMRAISFFSAIAACLFYGLVFDAVGGGIFDGLTCQLIAAGACPIPPQVDYWIVFAAVLFVIPLACYVSLFWFFRMLGALRSTALFGLLIFS